MDLVDVRQKDLSTTELMGRLLREYVKPYAGRLALAMIFMVAVAATTAGQAWLLQPAIDEIFVERSETMVLILPAVIIVIALIRGVATYTQSMLMNGTGQRIIAETQVKLYDHLINADLAYLNNIHSGQLVSSFLFDVNLLRDAVSRAITGIAKDLVSVIGLVAVMFYQDWRLACLVVFVFPAAGIFMRKVGKKSRKASTKTQEATGDLSAHLSDTLEAARVVKAYGMEAGETARARNAVEKRLKQIMVMTRVRAITSPLMEGLGGIAIGLAIMYGGYRGIEGEMTLGAFMSFLAALLMAYQPVKSLAGLNNSLQEGLAAAQRIFSLLDVIPTIGEKSDAQNLVIKDANVRFENVSFSYDDKTSAVRNVDLEVPHGQTVALVGPSGSGKTTLLNLLLRFYDVTDGAIRIDGQDLREISLASMRRAMALVTQDTVLFDETIGANISYGRPNASADEIAKAAKLAAADGFICEMPEGYDTLAGENGVKLSGGQRQRLAIARAILKDAPILLLDEATSALDTESERQVQEALEQLRRGRTTLVVAHRLSTVMGADMIHVLDKGRIVESGKHADLLAKGGHYARLYRLQFSAQDPAPAQASRTP
jgi:subfamily B ATP-binding cassette protein MsbA